MHLDQSKACLQLHLDLPSKKNTIFITPWDFHEWVRIQSFMEHYLEGYRYKFAIPYLDELLIYSAIFDVHLDHL